MGPATGEIFRGFVDPRGFTVLAGGDCHRRCYPNSPSGPQRVRAVHHGRNQYLAKNASSPRYEGTIVVGEDQWSYDETTMLQMNELADPFAHSGHNTLCRTD